MPAWRGSRSPSCSAPGSRRSTSWPRSWCSCCRSSSSRTSGSSRSRGLRAGDPHPARPCPGRPAGRGMIGAMFLTTLVLHSLLRWAVLAFGLLAAARALQGWFGPRPWTRLDDRAGKYFVMSLDLQTLVGLVLYGGLSPITRAAFGNMAVTMKDTLLRFYAVEHLSMMLLGL